MLDVSRHFFSVAEVKRYIDLASLYKLNKLHLHLADDQGWRIQVDSWPRLTTYGGSLEVGGTPGGSYTKAEYAAIVQYADRPLSDRHPRDRHSWSHQRGTGVVRRAELRRRRSAALHRHRGRLQLAVRRQGHHVRRSWTTCSARSPSRHPGDVLHLGGDEAHSTPHSDYLTFVPKASALVAKQGKRVMGWQEIAETPLPAGQHRAVLGYRRRRSRELARKAAAQGAKVVLSPANRAYLDMKYDASTPYGLDWAGLVSVAEVLRAGTRPR